MATHLLATKLYIPAPRADAVARPRLFARLDAGLAARLLLISAPAGFGKTTLVAGWLAARPALRAAWLSLDEADADLARFLTYLVAALRAPAPDFAGAVLAALDAPQPPPSEALLTLLLNELAALPGDTALVLDDYHLVDAPAIDRALTFLIERLPPSVRVVITTRADPPLPLARLRARGHLAELRAADLSFTPAEATDFLNRAMRLDLSPADVAALEARTEGWIAGLQLAALALGAQAAPPADFIASFTGSHRFVLDYLLEEVLDRQPPAIQSFLLRTAILDRLCGPLCDAVTAASDGQASLERLERANLFIIPLDSERCWYRYHHLFADLLRRRLAASASDARELHRRASAWFADAGLPDEAFRHALAAGDPGGAAAIAERAWLATFRTYYQNALFLGWMRNLTDDVIRARPVLCAGYAWALLDFGEFADADAWLRAAERWLDADSAALGGMVVEDAGAFAGLPGSVAVARAYLSMAQGDAHAAEQHAQRALALLPPEDAYGRAGAVALLGLARQQQGDLPAAERAFLDSLTLVRGLGQPAFELSGVLPLASIKLAQGKLRETVRLYGQALASAEARGGVPGMGDVLVGLGNLAVEQGDVDLAEQHARRCEELGEGARLAGCVYHLRLLQARLAELRGDIPAAHRLLDSAEAAYYPSPLPDTRPVPALRARLAIRSGSAADALAWAADAGLSPDGAPDIAREFEQITLARALVTHGAARRDLIALRGAEAFLARLLLAAEAGGRWGSALDILVPLALSRAARDDQSAAHAALDRALALAEGEGYVRLFLDEGAPMRRLLAAAAARGSRYAARLTTAEPANSRPSPAAPAALPEPLTERETEILRLIAAGLTNQQIAGRLHLALDTIKGHNRVLFAKLAVDRRTEAVARARELGLI
ncbi:MAG: LuxR C-terminal-related transcriptional regulator [Anaerolineae bacterium]|nr:LuxR C-terminal-related transcriptional regulator [Anaerolineae bacterium]